MHCFRSDRRIERRNLWGGQWTYWIICQIIFSRHDILKYWKMSHLAQSYIFSWQIFMVWYYYYHMVILLPQ